MDYQSETDLAYPAADAWRHRIRRRIGKALYYFSEPARQISLLERRAYVQRARSPGPRLTAQEINELASFMLDVQELPTRRDYFRTRSIETTFQGLIIPLLDWVISEDPKVKSVMNIGANYGYCDYIVASRHPEVAFLAVDFAPNFVEFNKEFSRHNLSFRSGYAMDILECGEVRPDLIIMSSTAVVIKIAELKRYFAIAANLGSYMVLNEPLYNLPGNGIIDPLTVSPDESVPVYQYTMANGNPGPLCYTHNYKSLLERAGMEVIFYKAFRPSFADIRMAQVIARSSSSIAP